MIKKISKIFLIVLIIFFIGLFITLKLNNLKKIPAVMKGNLSQEQKTVIFKKLNSLFVLDLPGKKVDNEIKSFIKAYQPGGIIIMGANVKDVNQASNFILDIKSIYKNLTGNIFRQKPFITVDQEGGRVRRFKTGIDDVPSARECALKGREYVKEKAVQTSQALLNIGINVNFAPVADVLVHPENRVIGDRSFGNNELIVSEMVKAYLEGSKSTQIITCAKHFPGHGSVSQDSHLDLPTDYSTENDLLLKPFKSAIDFDVKMVMIAHILFPKVDSVPSTMSSKIISILRNKLNFNGVIISDDMNMGAMTKRFNKPEVIITSLKAGMDMFIHVIGSIKKQKNLIDKTFALLLKDTEALIALEKAFDRVRKLREIAF